KVASPLETPFESTGPVPVPANERGEEPAAGAFDLARWASAELDQPTAEPLELGGSKPRPASQARPRPAFAVGPKRSRKGLWIARIHIATTIAPSGVVTSAKIDKKAVDESPLGTCLKRAMKRIPFPPFTGDPFEVDIPIMVSGAD